MLKKFIPLDGEVGSSHTPYDIRTFKSPAYDDIQRLTYNDPCSYGEPLQPCMLGKVPVSKPVTTEEAIIRLFEIPLQPRFQTFCKKRCKDLDPYTECVMQQKPPKALKHHSIVREKYLKMDADLKLRVHDAQEPSSDEANLIQMDSLIFTDGRVQPKPASPACSLEIFYVPSRRLLDLKRPRSGIFINETPRSVDSNIPFGTYNPRKLQEKLDGENRRKYSLFSDGNKFYFPWLQGEDDIRETKSAQIDALRQACVNFKPVIFPIPSDLHKTFRAEVVFSNAALPPYDGNIKPQRPMEIASLYAAYVETFSRNPDYWDANVLDSILESGTALCEKSTATMYENPKADFDIIPELTENQATVQIKSHLTAGLTDEPNILKALTVFFNKFPAGVLRSEKLYLLIWRRYANSFYIFDPNGRDMQCRRDFNSGMASLMAIETVEHIVHLILNYSDVSSTADFDLYEIHLKDFGKLSNPLKLERVKPPKKQYATVNRFYSIIPALSGLPAGKSPGDNASLMISYLALAYSQIDPPWEWTMQLVDDLIKFGRKYNSDYTCDNRLRKLNVVDLPEVLLLGNYRVLVEKKPFARAGHVVECRSYRDSQLTRAIVDFLSDYDTGILQLDSASFALWRESNVFFFLDAFKRGPAGQATVRAKTGVGCLQMHLSIESLCRIVFMNSIAIITEGNFFLHGIRVKAIGTFNVNRALEDAAAFGTLQIKYPLSCERSKPHDCKGNTLYADMNRTLTQCLSELSVSPCERTCSEREFIQQQKKAALRRKLTEAQSIQSIPEQYRFPEFDNIDVIDSVLGEFICDLMTKIQRKTERKPRVCIEASKILLQSDRGHLEDLKLRLKRGEDYDNICAAFKTKPPVQADLSLEEELAMESNFTQLPDGSWAIFGITDLDIASESLKGILATIAAAALSSKYKVSTWSSDVVEYALEACSILEERFWSFSHTLDLIFRKEIPKIQLGSTMYYLKVIASETVAPDTLKNALNASLLRASRLILICKGLSCLIVKRYNLVYMFMGCPCDAVGFRSKSPGPMCLLRFLDINSLVRRIENACGRCGKYVVVELEVKDITEPMPDKFVRPTASREELTYGRELTEKQRKRQAHRDKMKFIQHEIRQESKRVNHFRREKLRHSRNQTRRPTVTSVRHSSYSDVTEEGAEGAEGDGEGDPDLYEESEKSVEYKHKSGRSLTKQEQFDNETTILPQQGYQLRNADCLFKIQGSTALPDRLVTAFDTIKTCFFASAVALIYAILRPLNNWDGQRIDKVIHVADNIAKRTTNFTTASERIIRNIDVDEFTFEAKVQAFTPMGCFGGDLEYVINKTIKSQRYFLIQIPNGTFAVHHDKYFHLFDPYPSMEFAPEQDVVDEDEAQCPEHIPPQPERNTASWILFGDLSTMLDYIHKRSTSSSWQTEYKLHSVSITSYRTAPKRTQLLNLLTDELDNCQNTPEGTNLCTHPEQIDWLDIYPNLVIWSRLNRFNAAQQVRGSALAKDRNFDIEIPDKIYSLWGSIHPLSAVFGKSRGKQHLAIDVVACCLASVYQVGEWNTQILDSIVINGNDYYNDSVNMIKRRDYEISLEHLNTVLEMGHLYFVVHLESVASGYLYAKRKNEMNLAAALTYFFSKFRYGIIQCMQRSVAIGKHDSGFFMFECQSSGLPLFKRGEGAAYVLRTTQLQVLLYCIVTTLYIPYYNAQFTIHKVEVINEKIDEQDVEGE